VNEILSLAEGFQRVAVNTGSITLPRALISLPPQFRHLAIGLVSSNEARIWRHHRPGLVEFICPGMLFEGGHYPVHQMLQHTHIEGMKYIGYNNNHRRDAFHIPEDCF